MIWFMAAWLRSPEFLRGPGDTGATDGVIAGGMVMKAGPAHAEATAAARPSTIAYLFTV